MLNAIHIKNFITIEQLVLEFNNGLTVLTGETGAGKSILVDALALSLGDRCESNVVRANSDYAEIQVCFNIDNLVGARKYLHSNLLSSDENNECFIRRIINKQGRSKALINGHIVNLRQLKDLANLLVNIHGQHQHQQLANISYQLKYLDGFANNSNLLSQMSLVFKQYKEAHKLLIAKKENLQQQQQRLNYLDYQLKELQELDINTTEIIELEQEQKKLANLYQLQESSNLCKDLLSSHSQFNILDSLQKCINSTDKMQQFDEKCQVINNLLNESLVNAEEANSELCNYLNKTELDPQRQEYVEQKLSSIYELARKHKVKTTELPSLLQKMQAEFNELNNSEQSIESLRQQSYSLWQEYLKISKQVSKNRNQAAEKLNTKVNNTLSKLNLKDAKLNFQLTEKLEQDYDIKGIDKLDLLVCLNSGQEFTHLHKTASGGELSRISLAIEVATMHNKTASTMIFDEVDVGIGGATAEIVGKLLRELGSQHQVLCITHLAQVAAQGHQHMLVNKALSQDSKQTISSIKILNDKQRVQEIARMLAGVNISELSIENAKAMLQSNKS